MIEYRVIYTRLASEAMTDLSVVKRLIKDMSYLKSGLFALVEERVCDGTLGTPWLPSTLTTKIEGYNCSIYCIDGMVMSGYVYVKEYLIKTCKFTENESNEVIFHLI